jgi:hypothetical protein
MQGGDTGLAAKEGREEEVIAAVLVIAVLLLFIALRSGATESAEVAVPVHFTGPDDADSEWAFEDEVEARFLKLFHDEIDHHFHSRIAGISKCNDDGTSRQSLLRECKQFDMLMLARDPENQYDAGAVAVMDEKQRQLGYLPHEVAEQIAPEMDKGRVWMGAITRIGQPDTSEYLGAAIFLFRLTTEGEQRFVKSKGVAL